MTAAADEPAPAEVPDPLRAALVRFAADVLGAMEPRDVPAGLRAVQRFTPKRRATVGAVPLWVALQEDGFRAKVAGAWSGAHPDLAARQFMALVNADLPATREPGQEPNAAEIRKAASNAVRTFLRAFGKR